MDVLIQDLRYGTRMLRQNPGFTLIAVLTLALGVGANAAIFSVLNAVLLRPLPFRDPGRLVAVLTTSQGGRSGGTASYPNFLDWRAQNHVLQAMSVWRDENFTLVGKGEPVQAAGMIVSANLFSMLGVLPELGREFAASEDRPSSTGLPVILSHRFWQSRFGSDPQVIGRALTLNDRSFTVVGVMPAGFQFPIQNDAVDLWTTIAYDALGGGTPITEQRGAAYLSVTGRLKPHVSIVQAQAELNAIQAGTNKQYPENRPIGINVVAEIDRVVGMMRTPLMMLLGVVAFVLLIACANVANLLLAKATARRHEIGIRLALGASRRMIVRQLLTESLLLSTLGGALGLFLATWAISLLIRLAPSLLARVAETSVDWRVLGFTMLIAAATGLLFGIFPALQISRSTFAGALNESGRSRSAGAHRSRVRSSLVVSETALALLLLVGAGLLLRSLWRLHRVDPGFVTDRVVTFYLDPPATRYNATHIVDFYRTLLQQIQTVPGVHSASAILGLPLSSAGIFSRFQVEEHPVPASQRPRLAFRVVDLDYFRTMGIPLLKGRDFTPQDDVKSTPVVVVNQTLAQRFFPGEDPVGKRIQTGVSYTRGDSPMLQIVGVVGDVRAESLASDPLPEAYVPHAQAPNHYMSVVVRTSLPPQSMIPALRQLVWSLDKDLPLLDIKTLDEYVSDSIAPPRFVTLLFGVFAGLAFVLTAIGFYGVVSYSVAQRTRELGIRMALGAQRKNILGMVVQQGLALAVMGVAAGLAAALALTRLMASLLFGVRPTDPATFAMVVLLLLLIALLASYLPARRATKVDPMLALRYE